MAIFHLSAKPISRNQGRSSVAAAAYRAGERLHNNYDGQTHDFTRKKGIIHKEIMLPENAPVQFLDREALWNAIEAVEKRKDARTAREIELALPLELSLDEQVELVREYVTANFLSENMCADICIHDGKHEHRKDMRNIEAEHDNIITPDNPHAHILLTDRPIGKDGQFIKKNPEWNKKERLILWRKNWADAQNREFERRSLDIRVSHESNIARGIDREPTIHLGHKAAAMERQGIRTERGDENRAIMARNKARYERLRRIRQEREQNRSRRLRTARNQPLDPSKSAKRFKSMAKAQTISHINAKNGRTKTLFEAKQDEDRKGRAKARRHIKDIKAQVERELLAEQSQKAKEERQQRLRKEHAERQRQREQERKQKRERDKDKARDRDDSSNRSR